MTEEDRQELTAVAERLGLAVTREELLAGHTTFRIGGPADLFATAATVGQLEALVDLAFRLRIPTTVLGGGSNVLVSDAGVRGLVIANGTRSFGFESDQPDLLVADAGVMLAGLARWAIRQGRSGLEWAVSVPGSVGGAAIGNAGAYGSDIAASLAWIQVADPGAGLRCLKAEELEFTYRSTCLKREAATGRPVPIVLRAAFRLGAGDADEMAQRAAGFLAHRRQTQPAEPSAGSVFRNPPGDHAGRLIEAAGLKGCRIGEAQVSERHANFIVNLGQATAQDVADLMNLVRRRVYGQSGIRLTPEIIFLGQWPTEPLSAL